jgi:hypothetical protein
MLASIMAVILMTWTQADFKGVTPNNFNQCIEEDILMCWDSYEPTRKADISLQEGSYRLDIYNMVRDEWQLVTTIDDISCLEELGSYLEARGFVVYWPW